MRGQVRHALAARELELGPPVAAAGSWSHWRLGRDGEGIAWLLFDQADANANTLSEAVLRELDAVLEQIEQAPPEGLVIRSAKHAGFIAGADIGELRGCTDPDAVAQRLREGHRIIDRLAGLSLPTIAVIHGYCLGGGLELALACAHRIAIEGAKFGFPEISLGLHPGLGGTVRATELIDPSEAMTLMLTGKPIDARRALTLGLVDVVTEERHIRNAVGASVTGKLAASGHGLREAALNVGPARTFAAKRMRAKAEEKALPEHYPAPYRLIDLWEEHGGDRDAMLADEIRSFAELLATDTAQNLIRVFFLRERLKMPACNGVEFRHVHVVGAGTMGGDIAAWCALQGLTVTLADTETARLADAIKRAAVLCQQRQLEAAEIRAALDRLIPDLRGAGVRHAEVIIEAVPEDLALKQEVYKSIEPQLKAGAILASNTSSLPLEQLRTALQEPGRLVGLHFFSPVARMPLIEVVRHDAASAASVAAATAFTGRIDRLAAPVRSAPGFLVNRALTPYLLEALMLLDEGLAKETIDSAAEQFGMPMGPVELADQVGLDICLAVADSLRAALDRPLPEPPDWLRKMVGGGQLGRKTGKGLYDWREGKVQKSSEAAAPDGATTDRLILPMIDACVACLRQGVAPDADTVDGAMIFATGFAPFRGGPLHYAKTRGVEDVVATLERLATEHGQRFAPDPGWQRLA